MSPQLDVNMQNFVKQLKNKVLKPFLQMRINADIKAHFAELLKSQYRPFGELEELQLKRLQSLITHAFETVPFYRKRFDEVGLHPSNIKSLDDIRLVPILTRRDIIENFNSLRSSKFKDSDCHLSATGGSTGLRTPFIRDNSCLRAKRALEYRYNTFAKWKFGEKIAYVWPALQDFDVNTKWSRFLPKSGFDRSKMFAAGRLNKEQLKSIVLGLQKFNPALIRAFPSALEQVAFFAISQKKKIVIKPRGVILVGEPLLDSQRQVFAEAFGCQVHDCYVSRECGQHACECEAHTGMHINCESLLLEFDVSGRPARPGETGEIIITDFENRAMPFIRYAIGDLGTPLSGTCPCGRTLPRMAVSAGRVSDFLVSPVDGSLVSGASICHYLLACGPAVGQIQIIQPALEKIVLRVRRSDTSDASFGANLDEVKKTIMRMLGENICIEVELCDEIAREASGKYRFCIGHITKAIR